MEIFHTGLAVKKILTSMAGLSQHLKNNSFPLVAPVGTEFPFITYRRVSGRVTNTQKDYSDETATVELNLYCDNYSESVQTIHSIANAFLILWKNYVPAQQDPYQMREIMQAIDDIDITQSTEEYYSDTYKQTIYLEFTFK